MTGLGAERCPTCGHLEGPAAHGRFVAGVDGLGLFMLGAPGQEVALFVLEGHPRLDVHQGRRVGVFLQEGRVVLLACRDDLEHGQGDGEIRAGLDGVEFACVTVGHGGPDGVEHDDLGAVLLARCQWLSIPALPHLEKESKPNQTWYLALS